MVIQNSYNNEHEKEMLPRDRHVYLLLKNSSFLKCRMNGVCYFCLFYCIFF